MEHQRIGLLHFTYLIIIKLFEKITLSTSELSFILVKEQNHTINSIVWHIYYTLNIMLKFIIAFKKKKFFRNIYIYCRLYSSCQKHGVIC